MRRQEIKALKNLLISNSQPDGSALIRRTRLLSSFYAVKTAGKGVRQSSLTTFETETPKAGISLYLIVLRASPSGNPAPVAAFLSPVFLSLADIPPRLI